MPKVEIELSATELNAGDPLTFGIRLGQDINLAFDLYIVVETPIGLFTIDLEGRVARVIDGIGIQPVAANVSGCTAPWEATIWKDRPVPATVRGLCTFYVGTIQTGETPPVPTLADMGPETLYVISFNTQTVEVK